MLLEAIYLYITVFPEDVHTLGGKPSLYVMLISSAIRTRIKKYDYKVAMN